MDTQALTLRKIDLLVDKGNDTIKAIEQNYVQEHIFQAFRTQSLFFIKNLLGENSTYFQEFNEITKTTNVVTLLSATMILKSLKEDIEQGWIRTYKQLVSAEIFSDFLEMGEYLLIEGYKDPAAVIIGSTLEENLRQLCLVNSINLTIEKDGKSIPKRADLLNTELQKNGVYNVLEQKSITAWLDLRNKAAHGKYNEYANDQVRQMFQGVKSFITRYL
jgi:hypothetical protein